MTEQLRSVVELVSASAEETQGIGRALGERARPGDLFLLVGGLGAGKTTLTQGIAWGLGVREHARSPTFVLMAQYQGRLPIYHIDLYRVDSVEEALDLGLDDYLWGDGVSVVEWADRAAEAFPGDHLTVHLELIGEESRRLRLEARGSRYKELLADAAGPPVPSGGVGSGGPAEGLA